MKEKIEEIGKVRLDLKHYPGEDYYCDGEIEDELLDITKNYAEVEYPRIIEERKSWPVLYHLSALRENIVEWLPIDKDMKDIRMFRQWQWSIKMCCVISWISAGWTTWL